MKTKNYCLNCSSYMQYYVKDCCQFVEQNFGYCIEKKKPVKEDSTCRYWSDNYLRNLLNNLKCKLM